jgi:hypothetical protein
MLMQYEIEEHLLPHRYRHPGSGHCNRESTVGSVETTEPKAFRLDRFRTIVKPCGCP